MFDCQNTNLTALIAEIRDKHSKVLLEESKIDFSEMVTFPECVLLAVDHTLYKTEEYKRTISRIRKYIDELEKRKAEKSSEVVCSDIVVSYRASVELVVIEEVLSILKKALRGE